MTPPTTLQALVVLAEKATPNEWIGSYDTVEQHMTGRVVAHTDVGPRHGQFRIDGAEATANARFIAAANPQTIINLAKEDAELRARVAELEVQARLVLDSAADISIPTQLALALISLASLLGGTTP